MTRWFRRVHVIATAIVGAQLVVWTITGLAFTLFDFRVVHGDDDKAPPEVLQLSAALLSPAEAVSRGGGRATSAELTMLDGRATYVVSDVLVDAVTGAVVSIDGERASRIAKRAFARSTSVKSVERREKDFVVTLDDPRTTEVWVDATTGKVSSWRNSAWRTFDAFWSLHVIGYIDRKSPANWPLRVAAFVAFAVTASGSVLLARAAAVRLRVRREARRRGTSRDLGVRAPS